MWNDVQFWKDSSWRAFRTFCQSLAGLLLAVQTSMQVSAMPAISIPWYGYLYASGIAGLVSLLQSVDRSRAVTESATGQSNAPSAPVAVQTPASVVVPLGTDHAVSVSCADLKG